MLKTCKILIRGRIQGVGFRPLVFVLAKKYKLNGSVSNNENGVVIFINGKSNDINSFYNDLVNNPPPVSKIKNSDIREVSFQDYKEFKIIPSTKKGKLNLILTLDFAICDDCKKEISDQKNKRFNYPFTTCVNCGPRWAITKTFPFERNNTSIDAFEMCDDCNIEFKNPSNRRFHSQTNSCPTCGISFSLDNANESVLCDKKEEVFKKVNTLLKEGNIVAIKNTGGYLLCCDATNKEIVKRLREKKKRPNKPFAILYPSLQLLEHDLTINEYQKNYLNQRRHLLL